MHTHIYIYLYGYVCVCACAGVCVCACVYMLVYVFLYTYVFERIIIVALLGDHPRYKQSHERLHPRRELSVGVRYASKNRQLEPEANDPWGVGWRHRILPAIAHIDGTRCL